MNLTKNHLNDAVILAGTRTPIGKSRGILSGVRPDDLLAFVFQETLKQLHLDPSELDEVYAGCANQAGEDNRNIARMAALLAGFPYTLPGVTFNRLCASGLEAIWQATKSIWAGEHQLILCGGVESMSRAPWVMAKPEKAYPQGSPAIYDSALGWRFPNPKMAERFPLESLGQTAENVAKKYNISRKRQDEWALNSHKKATKARQKGFFDGEITPFHNLSKDECIREDSTLEQLTSLKPVFLQDGSVTPGNSSPLNDGACALLISSREYAQAHGLPILGVIRQGQSSGVDPNLMGLGPILATQKLLQKSHLSIQDINCFELNEAFSAQVLAVMDELHIPYEKVNLNGGAIAIGHPLGCSGARLALTLCRILEEQKQELGIASLCVGVGQGLSILLSRN